MTSAPERQIARGRRQKARIMILIAVTPMTAKQLSEKLGITTKAVLLHTKAMMESVPRKIYVSGWLPNVNGRPAPLYMAGERQNVPYVAKRKPVMNLPDRNVIHMARLVEILEQSPRTVNELSVLMNISHSRVRLYTKRLRDMRWGRIHAWRDPEGRGDQSPVYGLGDKKDAPKPARKTRAHFHKQMMSDPERHAHALAKKRAQSYVDKHKAKPQGIFAALGLP